MYNKKSENISKLNYLENLNKEIPLWLQWLEPILYAKKNAKDIFEIEEIDIKEIELERFKKKLFLQLKKQSLDRKEKIKLLDNFHDKKKELEYIYFI